MAGTAAIGSAAEQRLTDLLGPAVAETGMELESVRVTRAGRRMVLRVVVDSDHGVSLDDVADVSRTVSDKLDAANAMGNQPYTLEVSSPGVDRPLTEPKHWRRAAGRLVKVPLTSGGVMTGRVMTADEDGVTLDVDGQPRGFGYAELGAGSIELEFGSRGAGPGGSGGRLEADGDGH